MLANSAEAQDAPRRGRDQAVEALTGEVHDKGWVVYSAPSKKGDWDLFICRPDGSNVRNVTNTPDFNEAYPLFSRDGSRLLYRRLPRNGTISGNDHGIQGQLTVSRSDGTKPEAFGEVGEYPWASSSPDGKQIACLGIKGITIVDLVSKKVVRTLPRQGFFQQMTWSPDGSSLSGVANNFGTGWSIACMDIASGKTRAVSKVDCCTPDWSPDGKRLIFSKRPAQWTQLWIAEADGRDPHLLYAEDGRHVYGGQISPDGKYALFTGNMNEDGDPGHGGAPMALMRLADAPLYGGDVAKLRLEYPNAKTGPVLTLPTGWEPCWTASEAPAGDAPSSELARELRSMGWIAFSAQTETGDWDLFVMRPDGSHRHALTSTPKFNEGGVRFSPDGKKILYYRMPVTEALDNNTYGTFDLVIADADGKNPVVLGGKFQWASWGPDSKQIACLAKDNVQIIDLATLKVVRESPRKGIVQQLTWSPDGQWFVGTANGLGPFWNIGRLSTRTGDINAISETDRYNCTPDWLPDSLRIVYARGIIPDKGGWAELWVANGDGKDKRVIYAEDNRHIYGGCASPDGRYVLFTRSESDLGKVDNSHTSMAIVRIADAPVICGKSAALKQRFPKAKSGPRLDLSWGWEPHWTVKEIGDAAATQAKP